MSIAVNLAMKRKIKPNALNRGTAVYLNDNLVRFIWPCGCTKVEAVTRPGGATIGAIGTARLVKNWRANGVTLPQCKKHPDWYSPLNQVPRLNAEHPQSIAAD